MYAPPAGPPRRRRIWPWLVLVAVLLVGGCSAALVVGGGWFVSTIRGPADAANTYLDEVRAGEPPTTTCEAGIQAPADLATSRGQRLSRVEIVNRSADVGGSLTLEDGSRIDVNLGLSRRDGGWCVEWVNTGSRLERSP